MPTPTLGRGSGVRAALVAIALALVPWRPAPAASLTSEPSPVPRSSRFT